MTKGYTRFKKCIERARENNQQLFIIVEGTLSDVKKGFKHSKFKGNSMVDKLFTLWVKYGVQTIYVKDRKEMSDYITSFYIACGKQHIKG